MSIHMLGVHIYRQYIIQKQCERRGLCAAHDCLWVGFCLFMFLFFVDSCTGFSDCMLDVKNYVVSQCNLFK